MKTPATRTPGIADLGTGAERSLFTRLSALLGAPLLLGGRAIGTVAATLGDQTGSPNRTPGGVRIAAPDHSVKRHG